MIVQLPIKIQPCFYCCFFICRR